MAAATFTSHQTQIHFLFKLPTFFKPKSKPIFTKVLMALNDSGPSVALVGVTGAVVQEFLSVLSDHDFPYRSIKMLASKRSAGKQLIFQDQTYSIEELREDSFDGVYIALFSAVGSISKEFGPTAVTKGSIVVDNSSAFRMDQNVPLVIPEVNLEAMRGIKIRNGEVLEGKPPTCNIFKQQYAFNLFSHNAPVLENGYNEEEMKLVKETRKIWNDMDVKVTATCRRVPVMCAHAKSVNLQFEKPLDENMAKEILKNAPGVVIIDDRASNHFPTPLEVSTKNDVAVGRIHRDVSQDGNFGLVIFVCGDQIRKGAALNVVQIAELLL